MEKGVEEGVEGRGKLDLPWLIQLHGKMQYSTDMHIAHSVDEHHFHDEHAAIKLRLGQFVWEF